MCKEQQSLILCCVHLMNIQFTVKRTMLQRQQSKGILEKGFFLFMITHQRGTEAV